MNLLSILLIVSRVLVSLKTGSFSTFSALDCFSSASCIIALLPRMRILSLALANASMLFALILRFITYCSFLFI